MIGIFDSGSGGLTVLRAIRDRLKSPDIVYFGDTKNAPYGSKSREQLSLLTVKGIELLQSRGARSIVSACNSVSASLAVSLFDALDLQPTELIEMVGPTVAAFKHSNARILLCATPATVHSEIYQNAFTMIGKNVTALPIEDLAGAIEFKKPEAELRQLISHALSSVSLEAFDVLILACTHYPLVAKLFSEIIPNTLALFDPALAVAARVEKQLWPREAGNGTTRFLISKDSAPFRSYVAGLFPKDTYDIEMVE